MSSVEKKITLEVLELYKGFSYLWDKRKILYNNKEARDKAYEVLCEKYKQIQSDITVPEIKKKMENWRTTFRREHRKVLISRMRGDDPVYTPTLFYYEPLLFLNEVSDYSDVTAGDSLLTPPPKLETRKRRLMVPIPFDSSTKKKKYISVFLPERENEHDNSKDNDNDVTDVEDDDAEHEYEHGFDEMVIEEDENHYSSKSRCLKECEFFGTTVGCQLKELDTKQRVIAEKLISDVIFYGRLQKLSENSSKLVL